MASGMQPYAEADESGAAAAEAIRHPAENRPEERSAEKRDRRQDAFLRGGEFEALARETAPAGRAAPTP